MEDPFLQPQNDERIDLTIGKSMLGTHRDVRNKKITNKSTCSATDKLCKDSMFHSTIKIYILWDFYDKILRLSAKCFTSA